MITTKDKVHNTSLCIVKEPFAQFLVARQWLKQEVYHHLDMDNTSHIQVCSFYNVQSSTDI
jgi:hypothetical protein